MFTGTIAPRFDTGAGFKSTLPELPPSVRQSVGPKDDNWESLLSRSRPAATWRAP